MYGASLMRLRILYEFATVTEKEQLFDFARVFFGEFNYILVKHVILLMCSITNVKSSRANAITA